MQNPEWNINQKQTEMGKRLIHIVTQWNSTRQLITQAGWDFKLHTISIVQDLLLSRIKILIDSGTVSYA